MYDAIIIGARCAGSPTGMLLARKGYRVLALDRSTFPSDIMSTHVVGGDAVARLEQWGLLDRVLATGVPQCTRPFTMVIDGQEHAWDFMPSDYPRSRPVAPILTRSSSTERAKPAPKFAKASLSVNCSGKTAGSPVSGALEPMAPKSRNVRH